MNPSNFITFSIVSVIRGVACVNKITVENFLCFINLCTRDHVKIIKRLIMSKYANFDNESKKKSLKLCKFLRSRNRSENDLRFEITKVNPPYSNNSPYNKILDFSNKTKAVCHSTDLSMFLEQCKVIFVGDANCGKTSLIKRFTTEGFDLDYKPTQGADYESKYFDVLDVGYNVGFWDVPGEEKFKQIVQSYYKNANVVVIVFDLTRPSTLSNATKWMQEALAANLKADPIRFLVGAKSDLLSKKTLEGLEAHANFVAQELDAEYFSVSSKNGTEVNNLFKRFTGLAFENSFQKLIKPPDYHTVKNNLSSKIVSEINKYSSINYHATSTFTTSDLIIKILIYKFSSQNWER